MRPQVVYYLHIKTFIKGSKAQRKDRTASFPNMAVKRETDDMCNEGESESSRTCDY